MTWDRGPSFTILDEDEVTLTQGSDTIVPVGASVDDHLLVAYGFASPAPSEDQIVQSKVMWDESRTEHVVVFEVDSASANPTINYTVYKVD